MNKFIISFGLIIISLFFYTDIIAQEEIGIWRTVDDKTNIDKSYVEIYIRNGKLYGKIVKILDKSDGENPLCTKCPGALKNKPILGMHVIKGLKKRRNDWYLDKGAFDPETGGTYDCKVWLKDNNTLQVRGYWGIFYRTQTWHRVK